MNGVWDDRANKHDESALCINFVATASARINQYERGKHTPDVLMATHLARVLNIPLSYFYAEDEGESELLLYYYRLPVRRRKQVLRLAAELAVG